MANAVSATSLGFVNGSSIYIAGLPSTDNCAFLNGGPYTITSIVGSSVLFSLTHANCTSTGFGTVTQPIVGSTTYNYTVYTGDGSGGISAPTATVTTTLGPATLGLTTYNLLTWNKVAGANIQYFVCRGSTYIATVGQAYTTSPIVYFPDYGQNVGAVPWGPTTCPASATNQALITTITAGAGTTSLTVANAAGATVTSVKTQHDATAAILAAQTDAQGIAGATGGSVFFPSNATFNFFSVPNFSCVGAGGWITWKVAGTLSPMVPITEGNCFFAIVGDGGGYGSTNVNFMKQPIATVQANGLNPVIRWSNIGAAYCENINVSAAFGDSFLLDNAADATLRNCWATSDSRAFGSPLRMNGSFGLYIYGGGYQVSGVFPGSTTTAAPGIMLSSAYNADSSRVIKMDDVFLNFAGIEVQDIAPGGNGHTQISLKGGILFENVTTPLVWVANQGSTGISGLSIENVTESDTVTASPLLLGSIQGATLINTSSGGLFGAGVNGASHFENASVSNTNTQVLPGGAFFFHNKFRNQFFGQTYLGGDGNLGILMPIPIGLTATAAAGAGLANNTYYYRVTATDAGQGDGNETGPSNEVSVVLTGANGQVNLSWTPPPGATNIKIYRGTATLVEGLVTTLAGNATTYTDVGGATGAAPPSVFNGLATWAWFGWFGGGTPRNWWWNPPAFQGFCTESPTVKFDVECAGAAKFGNGITTPSQITSTIATGTAPLVVASVTPVANLVAGGNTITVGSGTTTTNGTAVATLTSQSQPTITVTGATTTDVATCSLNAAMPATWQTGIVMLPPVVTANTVTIWLSNPTATANITPAAAVVRCAVTR
jgi:hypothetical protein